MNPETIVITDATGSTTARVLPTLGFNCYGFAVASRGETIELLWSDPEFPSGTKRPTRSGIPILFPYAGRLDGQTLRYNGQDYPQEHFDDAGHAMHGFVFGRPWRVIERAGDRLVAEFHAAQDDPALLGRWPADFRIRVGYSVRQRLLRCDITLENPGSVALPCGLGMHGYFRLPLASGGDSGECVVRVPVHDRWLLGPDKLPTGEREDGGLAAKLSAGLRFADAQLDDVFGGVQYSQGICQTSIEDPASNRTLLMRFDQFFRACVVFTPPHREAICIEPYTTIPDAFTLSDRGLDAGLLSIAPGGHLQTFFEIELRD